MSRKFKESKGKAIKSHRLTQSKVRTFDSGQQQS